MKYRLSVFLACEARYRGTIKVFSVLTADSGFLRVPN